MLSLMPQDKKKGFPRRTSLESIYSGGSTKFYHTAKHKVLHPLIGSTGTLGSTTNQNLKTGGDRFIPQRALSAKIHRVKQLQNQLADALYQINELSNENRLLRTLQKRQESALQRYENSNGDLPKVLHTHNEEIRVWQSRYKQLKQQYRDVSQRLAEKDAQMQHLESEYKHLVVLCKDKNLGEREKLQNQVADLKEKVQQQNDTITTLQRRITLENKNFKHRMQVEINKHKETKQDLHIAITNTDKLSSVIEMKDKFIASNIPKKVQSKILPTLNSIGNNSSLYPKSKGFVNEFKDKVFIRERGVSNGDVSSMKVSGKDQWRLQPSVKPIPRPKTKPRQSSFSGSGKSSIGSESFDGRKTSSSTDDTEQDLNTLSTAIKHGMNTVNMNGLSTDINFLKPDLDMEEKIKEMKKELMHKIIASEKRETSAIDYVKANKGYMTYSESSSDDSDSETVRDLHVNKKINGNFKDIPSTNQQSSSDFYLTSDPETKKNKIESSMEVYHKGIVKEVQKSSELINKRMLDFANSSKEEESILKQLEVLDTANKSLSTGKFIEMNEAKIPQDHMDPAELNNNLKSVSASDSSSLIDAERKNKLLEALKAIDRGEDVEPNLDGLKRPKSRNRKNKLR